MTKKLLGLVAVAVLSLVTDASVCRVGTVEYDTLQEAFDALKKKNKDVTITLTSDIDVTSVITIPELGSSSVCTVDGDGHTIRQAYAGRVFLGSTFFVNVSFRNVLILGGGESCSTVGDTDNGCNVVFKTQSDASSVTFDSGCIVSNFVSQGALVGQGQWTYNVKPGAVFACNRSASDGIFRVEKAGRLNILGGDFFGNVALNGAIAWIDSLNSKDADGMQDKLTISGGRFHDNTTTVADGSTAGALFYLDNGLQHVHMSGGEIFDNEATAFRVSRGGTEASFLHLSGGKIYGNSGYGVYIPETTTEGVVFLGGDAIVAGNAAGCHGIYLKEEWKATKRVALESDYSGYAQLFGAGESKLHQVGAAYGTNLASYAGAENIHCVDNMLRVLATDLETGNLVWAEPRSAKIGATTYTTLAAALSVAEDGTTIELMRDCLAEASLVPPANKKIVVDGCGHRVFRKGAFCLVDASAAGGDLTFVDVQLDAGRCYSAVAGASDLDGALVRTHSGVAATVTLGAGTTLIGGIGEQALVRVSNGATVNLEGVVVTDEDNVAVAADSGAVVNIKGATRICDNRKGGIVLADGQILRQTGGLTERVVVSVGEQPARPGTAFGLASSDYAGVENFEPWTAEGFGKKIYVENAEGVLRWYRPGCVILVR